VSHETRSAHRPASFREVFAGPEYRAIYAASTLSWIGDYLAKAAVTALVYRQTGSVTASAATFAISFLPWAVGGPVLAALAERYPHRAVMIICDVARAVIVTAIAIPGLPTPVMLLLLFTAALLHPPFDASRAALLPRILEGDRYVVGLAVQISTNQAAQLVGYLFGSALAAVNARLALLTDAGTFLLSAALVAAWVRSRPAVLSRSQRSHLLRETAQGFQIVFGTPVLRAIAVTVLAAHLFTAPPEGLAAAWAGRLEPAGSARGLAQGLIMMATPLGYFIGGLFISRLVPPDLRRRLIRPIAIVTPLTLAPTLLDPPAPVVALFAALCGVCVAGMLPASNGLFVQALPRQYRARANGVMMTGLQLVQGGAVMLTGALAAVTGQLPAVVGLWGLAGFLLMLLVAVRWPAREEFAAAIEQTSAANAAAEAAEAAQTAERAGVPVPAPGASPEVGATRSGTPMRAAESC
jgi:MFS family permease